MTPPVELAAGPDTRFAWSAVPDGVYKLLLPGHSPSQPSITVVTAQTSVGLPDPREVGVAFPTPLTTYVNRIYQLNNLGENSLLSLGDVIKLPPQ